MQKTMSKPFMTMVLTALICLVLLFLCYLMIGSKIAFFGWYTLWVLLILDFNSDGFFYICQHCF